MTDTPDLAELLARDLGRRTMIYVFPAWGDSSKVWAHEEPELRRRYLGMSAGMWHRVEAAQAYATGGEFPRGESFEVHLIPPSQSEVVLHTPNVVLTAALDTHPLDQGVAVKTLTIREPR